MSEIRYFNDGEQATAAVLNRPAKDLELVDSVMSKVQFEANAAARREQYAGSGFVEMGENWSNKVNQGISTWSTDWYVNHFGMGNNSGNRKQTPVVNVNGSIIDINHIHPTGGSYNLIPVPQASSAQIITDSTNAPAMKQGDFAILNDLNRELVENGNFENNIDGWSKISAAEVTYDADNKRLKCETTTDTGRYSGVHTSITCLKGITYKLSFNIEITNGNRVGVYIQPSGSDGTGRLLKYISASGFYEFEHNFGRDAHMLGFEPSIGTAVDEIIYVDNVSVKQVKEKSIVALQDVNTGDIYANASKFEGRDSVSRQDLVFLETWHENIADKDIVYPYGNIQYKGGNTDGVGGIADGTFTGAGTYSLFGNWQSENDLVGKGYKWSDLSLADKVKFASNHDNNVYRDGNNWVQVRYRVRVIKGLGNKWYTNNVTNSGSLAYNGSYGTGRIWSKNKQTGFTTSGYGGDYAGNDTGSYIRRLSDRSAYYPYNDESINALLIAKVQRRNAGIYDESFNPEGTAKVYVDGAAVYSYETNLINSMDDCFDRGNIAAVKPDNGDVSRLSAGTEGHVSTGSIASGVSGRPDGIYYDEVNERDVEDLRMSAHKRNYDELREEYKNKAITGDIRGKESSYISKTATFWFSSSTTVNEKNGGVYIWDDISKFYLSSSRGEYNGKLILENGQNENNKWREFFVEYIDINGDSLGFYKAIEYSYTDQFHTEKPINAVGMKVRYYYATGLTQNNTMTHCDIIGDPRKISQRIKLDITADSTQSIKKNDYFLCTLTDNNGGTAGHYYRYLINTEITGVHTNTTDGDANISNGHIDFSDTAKWIDLGSDGSLGGYSQKWLEHGVDGSPLIVGENGESLLPVDLIYNPNKSVTVKISKKGLGLKLLIVRAKNGEWVRFNSGGEAQDLEYYSNSANRPDNNIYWNVGNDNTISTLGYASIQEMLDLMIVKVYYETKTNFLELANNGKYKNISKYSNHFSRYDRLLGNYFLNKVNTESNYMGGLYEQMVNLKFMSNDRGTSRMTNQQLVGHHEADLIAPGSTSSAIKIFDYLTVSSNRARLQFAFKELKYDTDSSTWGDDNKFQITDKVSTVTDLNGNSVLYGQKAFDLPYFIGEN